MTPPAVKDHQKKTTPAKSWEELFDEKYCEGIMVEMSKEEIEEYSRKGGSWSTEAYKYVGDEIKSFISTTVIPQAKAEVMTELMKRADEYEKDNPWSENRTIIQLFLKNINTVSDLKTNIESKEGNGCPSESGAKRIKSRHY